jgi:hypothetical protein
MHQRGPFQTVPLLVHRGGERHEARSCDGGRSDKLKGQKCDALGKSVARLATVLATDLNGYKSIGRNVLRFDAPGPWPRGHGDHQHQVAGPQNHAADLRSLPYLGYHRCNRPAFEVRRTRFPKLAHVLGRRRVAHGTSGGLSLDFSRPLDTQRRA